MRLIYFLAVYILGIEIFQCTSYGANVTYAPTRPATTSVYSRGPPQEEVPKNFLGTDHLRTLHSIDEYITDGYKRWGGYDNFVTDSDGSVLLEYDMKITKEEYATYYHGDDNSLIQSSPSDWEPLQRHRRNYVKRRFKRKVLIRENSAWPGAIIPYQISKKFSSDDVKLIKESMQVWMDSTCVRFVPAQPYHQNVLTIQTEKGCSSYIGMIGGKQNLNLDKNCRVKHVIIHELGHVIGLIHEHQRPNRDSYIKIIKKNVGYNKMKNFRKFRAERVTDFGVKYDYTSIMHYGKRAFSKDRSKLTTMATLDPRFQDVIGHARTISFYDAKVVNLMYDCARPCRKVSYHCSTGYMTHNCKCVCRDGTKNCYRSLPVADTKVRFLDLLRYMNFGSNEDDEGKWSRPDFSYRKQS